jgi:hypothetical protein
MQKPLLAVLAFALLSGCGTVMSPVAGKAVNHSAMAIRSAGADADKHSVAPPVPLPARQAFSRNDVQAIATAAYADAYAAKTPEATQKIVTLALEKIRVMVPGSGLAVEIVPYAEGVMKTQVANDEDSRRLALWPLNFISKGLETSGDPRFFQMTQQVMEAMTTWQDGLAAGLTTLDYLNTSNNPMVKAEAAKALAEYRNPQNDLQESYKNTLATLKTIGTKLAALTH